MSTPVNLNKVRKARDKVAKRAQADENAARFGRSKQEKAVDKANEATRATRLDGHKRET